MALQMQMRTRSALVARPSARSAPAVVCRAQSSPQQSGAQLAAAAFAAAALLAMPAQAGVILQQPTLKKLGEAPAAQTSAPAASKPAAKPKSSPSVSEPNLGFSPQVLALPGAIGAIAGLAFAASKVDSGFTEWIQESGALVRNSGAYVGFEEEIKEKNPYQFDGVFPSKGGSPKAKKASKPKKGLFGK